MPRSPKILCTSICVRASSPIAWRPLAGGSEGAPMSFCGGRPALHMGLVGRSAATADRLNP
eukprot:8716433-Alexandrium_andersonii.AAC.1